MRTGVRQSTKSLERRSLTNQVLAGLMWLFLGTGAQMATRMLVLIVLARLLVPEDFGLVAAAMVVVNFIDTVSHLGIGPAITQRPKLTDAHIRTAVTLSLIVGIVLFVTVPIYAPVVAVMFNMQDLEPILVGLSAVFPLKSVGLVAESLMVRNLRFRSVARIEVYSYIVGYALVGGFFAILNYGSWALIYATLVQAGVRSVLSVVFEPHSWKLRLELSALRELLAFGGGFTLARIANTFALQGDNFVIGRWLGPSALGLYGRAYQLMVTPASLFGNVLDRVLFPAMARVQDDQGRLATSYRRGVSSIALLALPTSVVLYVLAPELVYILLGEGWDGVIAPFRILVAGTIFRTSYKISDSIARATGAVYARAWRQAVYAGLVFLGAWSGQLWGLEGVAVGVTLAIAIHFLLMADLSLRITRLTWEDFAKSHVPALSLASLLAAILLPLGKLLRDAHTGNAFTLVIVSITAVVASLAATSRFPSTFLGPSGLWVRSQVLTYVSRVLGNLVRQL